MKQYFSKIGPFGTLFSALCCFGTPVLIALLSALGLGFIINDAVLLPLLIFFLAINGWGLWSSFEKHHNRLPLVIHIISSVLLVVFIFVIYILPIAILGLIGVFSSSIWDYSINKHYIS